MTNGRLFGTYSLKTKQRAPTSRSSADPKVALTPRRVDHRVLRATAGRAGAHRAAVIHEVCDARPPRQVRSSRTQRQASLATRCSPPQTTFGRRGAVAFLPVRVAGVPLSTIGGRRRVARPWRRRICRCDGGPNQVRVGHSARRAARSASTVRPPEIALESRAHPQIRFGDPQHARFHSTAVGDGDSWSSACSRRRPTASLLIVGARQIVVASRPRWVRREEGAGALAGSRSRAAEARRLPRARPRNRDRRNDRPARYPARIRDRPRGPLRARTSALQS